MQPASLIHVLHIAAAHFGKSVLRDRDFLVGEINGARRVMWKDPGARELLFKAEGCECVACYEDVCNVSCYSKFSGITLPVNVMGLERLEVGGRHIDIVAMRLENEGCCGSPCAPGCRQGEILPTRVVLQNDIPKHNKAPLVFKAKDPLDKGKLVGIRYARENGSIIREDIKLSRSGYETTYAPVAVLDMTLPSRCGWVDIQLVTGFSLDMIHPAVTAPKHLRVRITGVRNGQVVKWVGPAEPLDVCFDTDIVEWGNEFDWKNIFMAIDLHFKTGKSNSEIFAYKAAMQMGQGSSDTELKATQTTPLRRLRPAAAKSLRRQIAKISGW